MIPSGRLSGSNPAKAKTLSSVFLRAEAIPERVEECARTRSVFGGANTQPEDVLKKESAARTDIVETDRERPAADVGKINFR